MVMWGYVGLVEVIAGVQIKCKWYMKWKDVRSQRYSRQERRTKEKEVENAMETGLTYWLRGFRGYVEGEGHL